MNKVEFETYENKAEFEKHENKVKLKAIEIESDYYFLQASYPADFPKERES